MRQERQLEWVHRNRSRHRAARHVSEGIARIAQDLGGGGLSRRLAAALIHEVDGEFRAHCRIHADGRRPDRAVVVSVDDPGLVFGLRLRWTRRLEAIWSAEPAARGRRPIRFEHGTAGVAVNEAQVDPPDHDGHANRSNRKKRAGPGAR